MTFELTADAGVLRGATDRTPDPQAKNDVVDSYNLGANCYIVKPLNFELLAVG